MASARERQTANPGYEFDDQPTLHPAGERSAEEGQSSGTLPFGFTEESRPTFEHLTAFMQTGDFRSATNIGLTEIRQLAEQISSSTNCGTALSLLEKALNMPENLVPTNSIQEADFLVGWFEAARGNGPNRPAVSDLANHFPLGIGFSSITDSAGGIPSTGTLFTTGVTAIYGVFENNAWATDLAQVLAIWRDEDNGRIVFQETESIRPDVPSNYVWLSSEQGWPAGHWQLDLYDPKQNFAWVATGQFEVR